MNVVKKIAGDWESTHQKESSRADGKPWGWQWGGDKIIAQVADRASEFVRGQRALEIGCGGGKWTKWLCDRCDEVHAVDVHPVAMREALSYEPRANYRMTDGESLPYAAGYFDVVFTWDVLLHLPDMLVTRYFQEVKRVLRGNFVFGLPSLDLPYGRKVYLDAVHGKRWREPYSYGHMSFYTGSQVFAMLDAAGFDDFMVCGPVGVSAPRDQVYVARSSA